MLYQSLGMFLCLMHSSQLVCTYEFFVCFFFFMQKTAYDLRISDWSSDVCSSDLVVCVVQLRSRSEPASDCRGAQDHRLVDADVGAFEVEAEGLALLHQRSEERRVGKECVRTCSSRW